MSTKTSKCDKCGCNVIYEIVHEREGRVFCCLRCGKFFYGGGRYRV